jgi:ferredoxin
MIDRFVYLKNVATLKLDGEKCFGCGACLEVCPHEVLARENGRVAIRDIDACMECGACARNCPAEAFTLRTGVGCAQAVINSWLGRNSSSACCAIESENMHPGGAKETGRGCC